MRSGKPIYKWNLRILADLMARTVNNKYDFVVAIEGKRGCLTGDTNILTSYGMERIDKIKGVSFLKALNLKNMKEVDTIAHKIDKGIQDVYEVKTSDGRIVKATMDHIFYVIRNNQIIELPLKNMIIGDELLCVK